MGEDKTNGKTANWETIRRDYLPNRTCISTYWWLLHASFYFPFQITVFLISYFSPVTELPLGCTRNNKVDFLIPRSLVGEASSIPDRCHNILDKHCTLTQ
jgi:hypothetical protein